MNKTRRSILTGLLALCMTLSLVPGAAFAEEKGTDSNVVTYTPVGTNQPHTIHWLKGITPPIMPGQDGKTLENADFKLINGYGIVLSQNEMQDAAKDPSVEEYYVSEYKPGNGWYDVNKYNETSGDDKQLCFALSAVNMMHWWLEQNTSRIDTYVKHGQLSDAQKTALNSYRNAPETIGQDPATSKLYTDMILKGYRNDGKQTGGFPDLPMDYFFNGYPLVREGDRNTLGKFENVPAQDGGLFYPVFGKSLLSDRIWSGRYADLQRNLPTYMDQGIAVALGYSVLGNKAHAVTLWGVELDENNKLCALYITDNNDTGKNGGMDKFGPQGHMGADSQLIGMIRYTAYDSNGITKITTYKDHQNRGSMIQGYYLLTLAEDGWRKYEDNKFREFSGENEGGQAFLHPVFDDDACSHHFKYAVMGPRIARSCTKCGKVEWVEMRVKYSRTYTGQRIEPCVMYSSLGNTYPFTPNLIQYSNNVDVGTATATMKYTTEGQTYVAELNFEIEKANQDTPSQPVEIDRTAHTVTLQNAVGMEYSKDGINWQESNTFTGLQANKAYTFYQRKVGDKNHNPSEKSEGLTVTTEVSGGENLNNYTITFDPNDGALANGVSSGRTDEYGKLTGLPNNPTREGYIFLGWYTAKEGGEPVKADRIYTADTTIFAHWKENVQKPAMEGTVQLSADPRLGTTVTASYEGGNVSRNNLSWQWYRNSDLISEANGVSYTLTADDIGKNITVVAKDKTGAHTGYVFQTVVGLKQAGTNLPQGTYHSIDYKHETIQAKQNYELEQGGTSAVKAIPSSTIRLRKAETDTQEASNWVDIRIPARPAFSGSVTATEDGKLTGVTSAMEYKTTGGWTDGTNNDITNLSKGTVVTVRLKATDKAFASDSQTYTIKGQEAGGSGGSGGSGSGGGGSIGGGGGGSIGGGGGGGGIMPPPTPELKPTVNPDKSVTTEEKLENDTVRKTTEWPNGDKAVVETDKEGIIKTEVTLKNGTTSTTTVDKEGKAQSQVKIPAKVAGESAGKGTAVALPVPAVTVDTRDGQSHTVKVALETAEPVRVSIPVEKATAGTVAVIVNPDGTETVVRKSLNDGKQVSLTLTDGATVKIVDNAKSFDDVKPDSWYANQVAFATSHELFGGTSATGFEPNASMTRGMLVKVLHNLESNPDNSYTGSFGDVDEGKWYADSVKWAAEQGIVNGYGDSFAPEDSITREQLAVILWRYSGSPEAKAEMNFLDANLISSYAETAMNWAVSTGILGGIGDLLDPSGDATRAQVATMMTRFMNLGQ